jgi:hypothetical protein
VLLLIAVIALALLDGYDRTPNWIGFALDRFWGYYESSSHAWRAGVLARLTLLSNRYCVGLLYHESRKIFQVSPAFFQTVMYLP